MVQDSYITTNKWHQLVALAERYDYDDIYSIKTFEKHEKGTVCAYITIQNNWIRSY